MRREFTVAVFVVHDGKVLLHRHRKLGRWLPPGGHVEPDETPDDAAVRETLEEAGLAIELVDAAPAPTGDAADGDQGGPRRLTQPLGIQLEDIPPGHQHVDLIYVARLRPGAAATPAPPADDADSRPGWYAPSEWTALGVSAEVRRWARAAVQMATRPAHLV